MKEFARDDATVVVGTVMTGDGRRMRVTVVATGLGEEPEDGRAKPKEVEIKAGASGEQRRGRAGESRLQCAPGGAAVYPPQPQTANDLSGGEQGYGIPGYSGLPAPARRINGQFGALVLNNVIDFLLD